MSHTFNDTRCEPASPSRGQHRLSTNRNHFDHHVLTWMVLKRFVVHMISLKDLIKSE